MWSFNVGGRGLMLDGLLGRKSPACFPRAGLISFKKKPGRGYCIVSVGSYTRPPRIQEENPKSGSMGHNVEKPINPETTQARFFVPSLPPVYVVSCNESLLPDAWAD